MQRVVRKSVMNTARYIPAYVKSILITLVWMILLVAILYSITWFIAMVGYALGLL